MVTNTLTRRGYTLIELVLVITLAAIALSAVAVLLKGVWQANRTAQDHRSATRSIQRLAMQFRDDVHTGTSAELANQALLIKQPDGEAVKYEVNEHAIQRTVESAGKVSHRDAFELPTGATAAFEAPEANKLASLVVTYPLNTAQPEYSDRRTLRIDAAITRSHALRAGALPPAME